MFLKKDLKNTLFFHLFVTIVVVYVKMNATKYAQFKQKQRKVKMREMNCKWLRMSNIS